MSQRKRHGEEEVKMSGSEYDLRVGNDLQAQAGAGGGGEEGRRKPCPESGCTSSDQVP